MKTFKQFLTEDKQSLNESKLPGILYTNLLIDKEDTDYDVLSNSHEQSYFNLTADMIDELSSIVNDRSDNEWAEVMNISVEEAKKEKNDYLKVLATWYTKKILEERLLKEISGVILNTEKFDHDTFVKLIKQYLKDWTK